MASDNLERQRGLYWTKMVELKAGGEYIRRYRTYLGSWVTRLAVVRAIASSASIGAWAVWRQYAFVWGLIIAVSQVLDALRDVFPFAKEHKAASELSIVLDSLFIDAQLEWENIYAGKYDEEQISKRLHKLRTLHHDAECRIFRHGLPLRKNLFAVAERDTASFFRKTYGVHLLKEGANHGGDKIQLGENER
jgi:hypothetical protein